MHSPLTSQGRRKSTKNGMTSNLDEPFAQVPLLPEPILRSFRELAEASAIPSTAALEGFTAAGKKLADAVQENCATTTRSLGEYSAAAIELASSNMRFAVELAGGAGGRSISDVISDSTVQTRRQFDALVAMQTGLLKLACDLSMRTINPLLEGLNRPIDDEAQ